MGVTNERFNKLQLATICTLLALQSKGYFGQSLKYDSDATNSTVQQILPKLCAALGTMQCVLDLSKLGASKIGVFG